MVEDSSTAKVAQFVSSWSIQNTPSKESVAARSSIVGPIATHGSAPFIVALPVLIRRSFKNLRRQEDAVLARLINPLLLAITFFFFFGRLTLAASTAQTRIGLIQETAALPFVGMLACLSIFPVERNLFLHEHKSASSRQSVFTFLLAYTVQEILVSIISSGLFSLVVVFGIGLQHSSRTFVEFWICSFALLNFGESIGIFFGTFIDGGLVVALVSVGITVLSQLNGITSVTLPTWLEYLGWISPMKLHAQVQTINEFTGLVLECSEAQLASGACTAGQYSPYRFADFVANIISFAETGEQLLETFRIMGGPSSTAGYVVIIVGAIVVCQCFSVSSFVLC